MSHTDELRERICRRYKEASADKYPTRFAPPSDVSYDFELPKRYYSNMMSKRPYWEYVGFYFDAVPANACRPEFERMLSDCRAGKIDLIITRNFSRFARGIAVGLNILKELAELTPPVGVYFENESIYSLSLQRSFLDEITKAAIAESNQKSGCHPYYMGFARGIARKDNQYGGKNESE